jgi:hypothetical protein
MYKDILKNINPRQAMKELDELFDDPVEDFEEDTEPCIMFSEEPNSSLEHDFKYNNFKIEEHAYEEIKDFVLKTQKKYAIGVSLFSIQCILDQINEELATLDHTKRKEKVR